MSNAETPAARIVTIARADKPSTRGYAYYAVVEYEAVPRKSDGVPTWRRIGQVTQRTTSKAKASRDLAEYLNEHPGDLYLEHVTHGTPAVVE